jgi:hypothetical protein
MANVSCKGFEISPASQQLRETREWTMNLCIRKHHGGETREKNFHTANTFKTKEEAEQHCLRFAQQIIDGQSQNCAVDDL